MKKIIMLTLSAVLEHFGLQKKEDLKIWHVTQFVGCGLACEGSAGDTYGKGFFIIQVDLARDEVQAPNTNIALVFHLANGKEQICVLKEDQGTDVRAVVV